MTFRHVSAISSVGAGPLIGDGATWAQEKSSMRGSTPTKNEIIEAFSPVGADSRIGEVAGPYAKNK